MESSGAEMVGQPDYLLGTCHNTQFASFTPFFIYLNSWHRSSLPDGLKKTSSFSESTIKQCLVNLRDLFSESKEICNFFHKVEAGTARPPMLGGVLKGLRLNSCIKGVNPSGFYQEVTSQEFFLEIKFLT
jgi:hypothetical protein